MSEDDWEPLGEGIDDLEEAAWEALKASSASVAAGPGSGKSEFLAQRAGFLFKTGRCPYPQEILAISFKKSAASNLRDRVQKRLPDYAPRFTSMTFDAFTKMIVDRFSALLPAPWTLDEYKISYSNKKEVEAFLDDIAGSAPPQLVDDIRSIPAFDFLARHVGATSLDDDLLSPQTAEAYAVHAWWTQNYIGRARATVDFVMLNRLADLIIRSSPQLRTALAATYPFVFVDEFQDTTFAQYSFLKEVFASSGTQVTAVGDRNQRIMGWAGALDDAFAEFEVDFAAETFVLTANYRSSPELVELQHRFARILSPKASKQTSHVLSETGDAPAQVWSFTDEDTEASKIGEWIRQDMNDSGRTASDYAILARQQVALMEPRFRTAFEEHDLRVRNDDLLVGVIRLQELLSDELTTLLIDVIRLGASIGGEPDAWMNVTSTLEALPEQTRHRRDSWEDRLSVFLTDLRTWFRETNELLPATTGAMELAAAVLERVTSFISMEELSGSRRFAENRDEVTTKLTAIGIRLASVLEETSAWNEVAGAFRQDDAVPLMTIHRSKGLEYHTVFIVGLDDNQWWSHANNSIESTMTFFVGVSRAAERIVFTHTTYGVSRRKVRDLYNELEEAGVPFLELD
ncbi:ATP-dependent helicase [Microbacterium sp. ISL-103]|uniref:UvrD-helicase domain-containing protein n=1 Tax=Microbacterium sp. ISL-103 TaxID=2819156 RepID=UPI001BEB962E|nr:ATP-dependent helicase [Microbacterium sp. ISL-103]MBT2474253.1 ATP-dependent helicase [Microbacterium sp. ISL-103]